MKLDFKEGDEVVDGTGHVFVLNRITKSDGVFLTSLEGDFQILMCLSSFKKEYRDRKRVKSFSLYDFLS